MREREWEIIFLRKAEALRRYLREARAARIFLTLLCRADSAVDAVKALKGSHQGLPARWFLGRTLARFERELEGMSLAIEDNGSPDEMCSAWKRRWTARPCAANRAILKNPPGKESGPFYPQIQTGFPQIIDNEQVPFIHSAGICAIRSKKRARL
jgi:hypothetical protein